MIVKAQTQIISRFMDCTIMRDCMKMTEVGRGAESHILAVSSLINICFRPLPSLKKPEMASKNF